MWKSMNPGVIGRIVRQASHKRWLAVPLLWSALTASAIPPPPAAPPQLREARMTVAIRLVEAIHGRIANITELCKVSGTIPVYADDGGATRANGGEISGCKMLWKRQSLNVSVRGAIAISDGPVTFAFASVSVVPPDAIPLCPGMCGPQPLADSRAEVKMNGNPKSINFSLNPNPVSLMNSKPTVWLEADVVAEGRGRTF